MKSTYVLSLLAAGATLFVGCSSQLDDELTMLGSGDAAWIRPTLVEGQRDQLDLYPGISLEASLKRLTQDPLDSKEFILADINFNQNRRFTNFSGDISGRYIEVCTLFSGREKMWPDTLSQVLDEVMQCQKEDGHFGIPVDWTKAIDFNPSSDQTAMMPILWGNGRLLLGLCAAADRFGRPDLLTSAKKLGDFYVNTVCPRFCDPTKVEEYKQKRQYASAYVTCVYEGMEGLINLYLKTKDKRYLDTVCKMADFHEQFDTVPEQHSHGCLSQTCALVRLYDVTGQDKYLQRAIHRWEEIVSAGYVNPTGGVSEVFTLTHTCDEGCSEGDWLRLNLLLWGDTGATKYLDMAERIYWNEIIPNQWPSGGFGHRNLAADEQGAYAFMKPLAESYWCCSFHVPWALGNMLSYLAPGSDNGIWYNFPMQFHSLANVKGQPWMITSTLSPDENKQNTLIYTVSINGSFGEPIPPFHIRVPEWAENVKVGLWKSGSKDNKVKSEILQSKVDGRKVVSIYTNEIADEHGINYTIEYTITPYLEDRHFKVVDIDKAEQAGVSKLTNVVVRQGQYVCMNKNSSNIEDIPMDQLMQKMAPYLSMTNQADPHAFICNVLLK